MSPWYLRAWAFIKAHKTTIFWLCLCALVIAVAFVTRTNARSLRIFDKALRKIDANKERADKEVKELEEAAEHQVREIELRHQEQIKKLEWQQRAEYEEVRRRGPNDVARWLNDFDKDMQ